MFKQSYHATHTTCGNQKLQEDDSFELGDIDDDIDELATTLLLNMLRCESVIL